MSSSCPPSWRGAHSTRRNSASVRATDIQKRSRRHRRSTSVRQQFQKKHTRSIEIWQLLVFLDY